MKRDPTTPIQSLISQIQKAQDLVEAASDPFEEKHLVRLGVKKANNISVTENVQPSQSVMWAETVTSRKFQESENDQEIVRCKEIKGKVGTDIFNP